MLSCPIHNTLGSLTVALRKLELTWPIGFWRGFMRNTSPGRFNTRSPSDGKAGWAAFPAEIIEENVQEVLLQKLG